MSKLNRILLREGFVGSDDPKYLNTESLCERFKNLFGLDNQIDDILTLADTDELLYEKTEELVKLLEGTFLNAEWFGGITITTGTIEYDEYRHLAILKDELTSGEESLVDLILAKATIVEDNLIILKELYTQYDEGIIKYTNLLAAATIVDSDKYLNDAVAFLSELKERILAYKLDSVLQKEEMVVVSPATPEEVITLAENLCFKVREFIPRAETFSGCLSGIVDDSVYQSIKDKLVYGDINKFIDLTCSKSINETLRFKQTTVEFAIKYIRAYITLLLLHIR